jgi:hypothetical protein
MNSIHNHGVRSGTATSPRRRRPDTRRTARQFRSRFWASRALLAGFIALLAACGARSPLTLLTSAEDSAPGVEPPPVDDGEVPRPPDDGEMPPTPEECRLAPHEPELRGDTFDVKGRTSEQDFVPLEADRWDWVNGGLGETYWPYPARALWPAELAVPVPSAEDVEFIALAGASEREFFLVGRRGEAPLVLRWEDGIWVDESEAVRAALPRATLANSVSRTEDGNVWITTPEGLVHSSNGDFVWRAVDVPRGVLPLGAVWINEQGRGVLTGGTVATTSDSGKTWTVETRKLGFVAPGLAYGRSFVRASGRGENMAVVGTFGHLLTHSTLEWNASTLFASDTAFTLAGQFVTLRSPSTALLFREGAGTWQVYPLSSSGGLDRVWATPSGDVFAGGSLFGILHRFADGTLEILPSRVNDIVDFHGGPSRLFALGATTLWSYELGEVRSSGVSEAALRDGSLAQVLPEATGDWGPSAASNFEVLDCVDGVIAGPGESVVQGTLEPRPPKARYGSCGGRAEREFSETALSFTAPITGTYRIALDVPAGEEAPGRTPLLRLALRNGCEGWVIGGGGRSNRSQAVDIGLLAGQVLLVEVYAASELEVAVPWEISIY